MRWWVANLHFILAADTTTTTDDGRSNDEVKELFVEIYYHPTLLFLCPAAAAGWLCRMLATMEPSVSERWHTFIQFLSSLHM